MRKTGSAYSDPSSAMLGIDALGYEPEKRVVLAQLDTGPQGMLLITGPTGSGKTVSPYTGLNIQPKILNISAEDLSKLTCRH